jgi:HAD superfamily hydrolase (TIGR01490 family)
LGLAIFDLDNTLIAGDSDYLWGRYLIEHGHVDETYYESENLRFYDEYKAGTLDIFEFLRFSLKPLSEHSMNELLQWRSDFFTEKIQPVMLEKAHTLIDKHRKQGNTILVITATNSFVTLPVIQAYGIDHFLATDPECIDNQFTGNVSGTPTFQHGKVIRYQQWLQENNLSFNKTWFYSDSHNDLPLLEVVDHPIAVDADPELKQVALMKNWQQISLR